MELELPIGWIEENLMTLAEISTGKRDANHATADGKYIFYTCSLQQTKSPTYSFEGKSIIVPGNGNIGYVFYYEGKFEAYQRTYVVNNILIYPRYLYYHFKKYWKARSEGNLFGSTIQYVKIGNFKDYNVGFPSLKEQQRIVCKLDTLFVNLDRIKTSMEHIPQLLKDFRQKVLTQAVTGKLTKEWRNLKKIPEYSKEVKLIDILIEKPRNGYSPQGVDYITNVKSLTLGATTSGKFNDLKVKYLDIETPKIDSYLWLKNGDILIQRSNSFDYVGVSAIYDGEDDDFIYPDLMMKLRVKDQSLIKYVFYQLSSKELRDYFRNNASGTAGNMPKINQGTVSNAPIILRSEDEQQEIVHRVESLFAKADQIEASYQKLKTKIEQLPQALLAKAFRGELVAQLPTDGDARDLLEQIKQAKEGLEKGGKGRKMKGKEKLNVAAEPKGKYGKK